MGVEKEVLKSFLNSDKPFSFMIWFYFAVLSIPIIRREIIKDDIAWKVLDLKVIQIDLPLSMYLLIVNILFSLFIIYFNKLVNLYFRKREETK